mmetsp:Transcript_36651/g.93617  ORF Transcript_36651/g.93617 Transcript_36651/m.93617 type:complete len:315 (+) Transcript_36651:586-1530(+)
MIRRMGPPSSTCPLSSTGTPPPTSPTLCWHIVLRRQRCLMRWRELGSCRRRASLMRWRDQLGSCRRRTSTHDPPASPLHGIYPIRFSIWTPRAPRPSCRRRAPRPRCAHSRLPPPDPVQPGRGRRPRGVGRTQGPSSSPSCLCGTKPAAQAGFVPRARVGKHLVLIGPCGRWARVGKLIGPSRWALPLSLTAMSWARPLGSTTSVPRTTCSASVKRGGAAAIRPPSLGGCAPRWQPRKGGPPGRTAIPPPPRGTPRAPTGCAALSGPTTPTRRSPRFSWRSWAVARRRALLGGARAPGNSAGTPLRRPIRGGRR